ncbi:MAG: serine/threonine protein kinase, partial [Acidobacteria bacterium]|nr:serine/threonine protein kinase [Acidobacteriota bacterium]
MDGDPLDRWRRVQELFEAAADLRPSEQQAYLAKACAGDDGLRREVEALLRSDAEAGSFIEHAIRRSSDLLLAAEPDPLEALGKIGKYEILGRIGEGGFGIVYKGRDAVLQRYVAVKTCSSSDEKLRRRFFREGQIAAGLQHPNITTVYDLGVERGIPYLVQEFLAGEDLNHVIARQEGLTAQRRLDILVQVARGLEYAHLQGVLHRDIKPANIRILPPPGAVKIMDFGIAKLLHEVSDVTTQGVTLGTVGYLAPEQLRGEAVDRRTDIFSFGVLVYELLSYRRPFPGSTFSEVSYRLLNEEPAPLHDLAPVHGRAITELAKRCLAKSPADRYESFAEIIAVLEPEATGADIAVADRLRLPPPRGAGADIAASGRLRLPQVPPRPLRSRLSQRLLGAAALALAVGLGAGGWAMLRHRPAGISGAHRPPEGSRFAAGSGRAPAAAARGVERDRSAAATAGATGTARSGGQGEQPAGGNGAAAGPANADGSPGATGPAAVAGSPGATAERAGAAGSPAAAAARPTGDGGGAAGTPGSPRAAPARPERRPGAPGPGRGEPPSARLGAASAAAAEGEARSRADAEMREGGQERGSRAERPPGSPAAAAAGAGTGAAGPAARPGGSAEDARRVPVAGGGGPTPGAAASDGGDGIPIRPMVRGDLIPPGAPHAAPPRLVSRPEPRYPDPA